MADQIKTPGNVVLDRLTMVGIDFAFIGMGIAGATQGIPALEDAQFPPGLTHTYGFVFAGVALVSLAQTVANRWVWLGFLSVLVSLASLIVLDVAVWGLVAEDGGGGRAYFFYFLWVGIFIQARRLIGLGYERGRRRLAKRGAA